MQNIINVPCKMKYYWWKKQFSKNWARLVWIFDNNSDKNKMHFNPFVFKCNYKLSPKIFRMAWQRQWLTTVSRNVILSLKNKVVQSKHLRNKDLNSNLLLTDHKTQENMIWRRKNKITQSNPNKCFLCQHHIPKFKQYNWLISYK